jgi:dTMP kinase
VINKNEKDNGRFISLEGGEGAGKSTQANKLKKYLESKGKEVVLTREPGGSLGAEELRNLLVSGKEDRWDPISETLILYAARREHWVKTIQPSLCQGSWVISDRFSDSTIVYQGFGKGVDRDLIEDLHLLTLGKIYPDLTFFLDIPAELGLKRSSHRDKKTETLDTRFENMNLAFHERLRNGFKTLSVNNPGRIISIDAKGSSKTVTTNIINILNNVFYSELSL